MSYFIIFLSFLIPFALIYGLYKLLNMFGRDSSLTPTENIVKRIDSISLNDIKKLKDNGMTLLSELISHMEHTGNKVVVDEKTNYVTKEPVVEKKVLQEVSVTKSNTNLILYLGSGLVTFAMLVLVLLGWNTMSDVFKIILLTVNVFGFLIVGAYLYGLEKFKSVGSTFLFVGSIGILLLSLGIWNFLLSEMIFEYRFIYWLVVSILSSTLNIALFRYVGEKKFSNLAIFSIYNTLTSFAFMLTPDTNLRVVLVLFLNFSLIFIPNTLKSLDINTLKSVSRILNTILSVIVTFIILTLNNKDLMLTDDMIVASFALILPFIYALVEYFKGIKTWNIYFELIATLFKVIPFILVWSISSEYYPFVLAIFVIAYIVLAQYVFKTQNKGLFYTSFTLATAFTTITATMIVFDRLVFNHYDIYITLAVLVTLYLVNLLIPVIYKKYLVIGFFNLLLLISFILIISRVFPTLSYTSYMFIYLGLSTVLGLVSDTVKNAKLSTMLSPLYWTTLFLSFVSMSASVSSSETVFSSTSMLVSVWSGISLLQLGARYFLNKGIVYRVLLNIFVMIFSVSFVRYIQEISTIWYIYRVSSSSLRSYVYTLYLVPALIYWIILEAKGYKKNILETILFILIFSIGFISSISYSYVALMFTLFILVVLVLRMVRGNSRWYTWIFGIFAIVFSRLIFDIFDINFLNFFHILVYTLFSIFGVVFIFRNRVNTATKYTMSVMSILTFITSVLYIFGAINSNFNIHDIFAYVLISVMLFISGMKEGFKLGIIPLVFISWLLFKEVDLNTQFYTIPITAYLGYLAYAYLRESNISRFEFFRNIAVLFQFTSLFIQSAFSSIEMNAIVSGVVLIVLSTLVLVYSLQSNINSLRIISVIFLLLALIVRLFFVIVLIPWWLYIGVLGMLLIAYAIFRVSRSK